MDPGSSPSICQQFADLCLRSMSPQELADLQRRIAAGPPPNDTLLPAALLGLAVFLIMAGSAIRPRLGMPKTAYNLGILAILVGGIVIGGVRIGQYPAGLPEAVGFGSDIVGAYGLPAGAAAVAAFVIGALVDHRWGVKGRDLSD